MILFALSLSAAVLYGEPQRSSTLFDLRASSSSEKQARNDLDSGVLYSRLRGLAYLVKHGQDSLQYLRAASKNTEPLVRFQALRLLNERVRDQALPAVRLALQDANPWVRLLAADTASDRADETMVDAIQSALKNKPDVATRLALEMALARATKQPLPTARPSATAATDIRRRVWTTHQNIENTPASPFEGYLRSNVGSIKDMGAAQDAGKLVYGRTLWGQLPDPVQLLVDPQEFEGLWPKLDRTMREDNSPLVDGLDLRLTLKHWVNWDAGWKLFCQDVGLDPEQIQGLRDKLTAAQQSAYKYWQLDRAVEGFNLMVDLIRLKHRYSRPNLQVSTYLPTHAPVDEPLRRLKFDLGVVEQHVTTDPLVGYSMCRMYKTLWPDRPVLYKTHGLSDKPPSSYWVYFDRAVPTQLIHPSTTRAYSNTLLAWMSGSHLLLTGRWYFLPAGYKTHRRKEYRPPGFDLHPEDFGPDLSQLDEALDFAFKDAAEYLRHKDAKLTDLNTGDEELDPIDLEIEEGPVDLLPAKKVAMRKGMRLIQKNIYDCARLFVSLPQFRPNPDVLVIQPGFSVFSRKSENPHPRIPTKALLNEFDFLPDINLVSACDLKRYKVILIHESTLLRDQTIRDLSAWLKQTPGLLIVHRFLSSDKTHEASSIADLDGRLSENWPWENDLDIQLPVENPRATNDVEEITLVGEAGRLEVSASTESSTINCRTAKAKPLLRHREKVVLARWQDRKRFKGAVLFDGMHYASREYLDFLTAEINGLAAEGIGRRVNDSPMLKQIQTNPFELVLSTRGQDGVKSASPLQGLDPLSGASNPQTGKGRRSALVAKKNYFHRYLACTPDMTALGAKEFSIAEVLDGGLRLKNEGLIHIASRNPVRVVTADGTDLHVKKFSIDWLLDGPAESMAIYKVPEEKRRLTFVRSKDVIHISEKRK